MIHEFHGHTEGAIAVVFSADDQTIISAGDDQYDPILGCGDWTAARGSSGTRRSDLESGLSPDGATIASAGRDGTIKIWDLEVPADYFKLPVIEPVSFGFERGGQTLLTLGILNGCCIARWDCPFGLADKTNSTRLNWRQPLLLGFLKRRSSAGDRGPKRHSDAMGHNDRPTARRHAWPPLRPKSAIWSFHRMAATFSWMTRSESMRFGTSRADARSRSRNKIAAARGQE